MGLVRRALLWASGSRWLAGHLPRMRFFRAARTRFMPGEDLTDALVAAAELSRHGITAMVTNLGEHVDDAAGAAAATGGYLGALAEIAGAPRDVEISVKLTQLGLDVDAALATANLDALTRRAGELGNYVWVDMESSAYVEPTLEAYGTVRRRHANVGVCLQAYLFRTAADAEALLAVGGGIRLVKGAYRERADVAYQKRADVDASFVRIADTLLRRGPATGARVALATHDVALLESVAAAAGPEAHGAYEVQMLYGIRTADQLRLAAAGQPVRVLIGYGTAWYAWFVRRLAERPANLGFVLRNLVRPAPVAASAVTENWRNHAA